MTKEALYHRLITDLDCLGLPVDEVQIEIRPYSKSYFGRYFIPYGNKIARIFIYPYTTPDMKLMYPYSVVLYYTIHEMVHHLQHTNPNFRRLKGVMHNPEFYKLFFLYIERSKRLELLKESVVSCYV